MSRYVLLLLWFVMIGFGLPAQGVPSPDRCKCAVVNKVFTVGGGCKCTIPGQGEEPAFDISTPVFPDGLPENGVCQKNACTGNNLCTYKSMRVTLTIAACARSCTGHEEDDPAVQFDRKPHPAMATVPSSGTVGFGQQANFTSVVPTLSSPNECGAGPFEETITFFKADGQHAFQIVFQYGCGNCRG